MTCNKSCIFIEILRSDVFFLLIGNWWWNLRGNSAILPTIPLPEAHTLKPRADIPWLGIAFLVPALLGLALVAALAWPLFAGLGSNPPVPANLTVASGNTGLSQDHIAADDRVATATKIGPDSPRIKGSPSKGDFWIDAPDDQLADYLVSVMSQTELLGQLFMFGWPKESATGAITDWISQRGLGGVKIFGWNGVKIDTLATTLGNMQDLALATRHGIPLLTATDQEGGPVRHIKDTTSTTPGAVAIGASGQAWDAYESSFLIAKELRAIGVNMNFSPTVDVYLNPAATVIGARAFGSDAVQVGLLSMAYLRGMRDAGVIATAKHFPGHGNASGDSHGMMPILQDSMETIWNRELLPYRMLIPEGLPAILIGHLAFPKITGNEIPASLNPVLNRKLLRDRLHFGGITITDDMFMAGATAYGSTHGWVMSDIVTIAVRAGNDMVMMSRTPDFDDKLWLKINDAFHNDPQFQKQVKESVRRILMVKLSYLKPANRVPLKPDTVKIYHEVPQAGAADFFRDQAGRSVTIQKKGVIPFKPKAGSHIALIGQDSDFLRQGQLLYPGAETFFFSYEPFAHADAASIASAQAIAARSDWVIVCLANPASLQVLQALEPWRHKLIILSTLTPIYLARLTWAETVIAVYGQEVDSFRFGFAALAGRYEPGGKMPVNLTR